MASYVDVLSAAGPDKSGGGAIATAAGTATTGLPELAAMLAATDTGIGFIYQALDLLAARYRLSDAVLRFDDPVIGVQMFRLNRTLTSDVAVGPTVVAGLALGANSLVADPDVVDEATASNLVHLARVALRLDLLGHDAGHDPLTGLLNRRSYEDSLALAVSRSCRYGWPFALVAIDLDEFKTVNDRLGHSAGDETLRALGSEVRAVLRKGDFAARIGGDEFALIVHNARLAEDIDPVLARLRQAMESRDPDTGIGFSAGVSFFPADASDSDTLARIADTRLYGAKQRMRRHSAESHNRI